MGERAFSIPFFRSSRTEDSPPQAHEEPQVDWTVWLAQLEALPPENTIWQDIDTFIESVLHLVHEKRQQIQHQENLANILAQLKTECAESLLFFGIPAAQEWDNRNCPINEAQSTAKEIRKLRSLLGQHQEKRDQSQAQTLAEELLHRKELLELEGQIAQVSEHIQTALQAAPPAPSATSSSPPIQPSPMPIKVQKPSATPAPSSQPEIKPIVPKEEATPAPSHPKELDKADTNKDDLTKSNKLDKPLSLATRTVSPHESSTAPEPPEAVATQQTTKPPSTPSRVENEESFHPPLDGSGRQYNPLTYAQERSLATMRSGVGFIFASEALGLSHIIEAYKRTHPADGPDAKQTQRVEVPAEIASGDQMQHWLHQYCQEHAGNERLMAYRVLGQSSHDQIKGQVEAALEVTKQATVLQHQLSVLFVFDPRATWAWLSLPADERTILEGQLKALILPKRWNVDGIRQRLSQHGKLATDTSSEAVLRATGGWPYLLDVLFYRCGAQQDPEPAAQTIDQEFQEKSTKLGQQFRHCLGLGDNTTARRVLEFLRQQQPVALNQVTPDAIGDDPRLDSSECWTALEYLQRTGCVDLSKGEFSVEPVAGQVLSLG